jgi:hypothetical protein
MALKGKPVAIGNTATTIYTCPASKEAAVHGLLFGNNTASALAVDVVIYNQATGSDVTVVTDLAVPANGIATWSKPINLNAGDAVKAVSSAATGMVCLYSTYEDGATPVASGFTARGVWSSAATYVANDIVSVSGSGTYVAIQGSTNQNPTTATAYWMFLEGISASALPAQSGNAGKYLTTDGSNASWGVVDVAGGATDTTSASANITLTSSSKKTQRIEFTGAGYSVVLPNATLLNKGDSFVIYNASSLYTFGVLNAANGVMTAVSPLGGIACSLIDNTTAKGSWEIDILSPQGEFAVVASYTNTNTTGLNTQSTTNTQAGGLHVVKLAENKWMTIWSDVDNNQYKAQAHSYDPTTNSISAGSVISWSCTGLNTNTAGYSDSGWSGECDAVYITDDVVLVTYYKNWDTASQVLGYRTISASGLTLTANAEVTKTESNTANTHSGFLTLAQNPYNLGTGVMTHGYYNGFNNVVGWKVTGTTVTLGNLYHSNLASQYGLIAWFTSATEGYFHGYYSDQGPFYVTPFTINNSTLALIYSGTINDADVRTRTSDAGMAYINTTDGYFACNNWSSGYSNFAWVTEGDRTVAPDVEIKVSLPNTVQGNEAGLVLESSNATTITLLQVVTSVAGLQGVGPVLRRITIDKSSKSYLLGGSSLLASSTINNGSRLNYYCSTHNVLNEIATGRYLHHGTDGDHNTIYNVISTSDK